VSKPDDANATVVRLIAHDLRNPLTAIQLNAQLIERAAERDGRDRERRWAGVIAGATRRLDDLISQLVEAERLRMGQLQLALLPVAWDELLREVLSDPTQAQLLLPGASVMVAADRERLGRAMHTLLRLVAQAREGAAPVVVELVVRDGRAWCTIAGPRLQGAAGSADAGAEPGQGIALHFARALVERLGGELRSKSDDPRVVGFEVVLALAT
jgi:signal transduction histidine kinase